jgi:transcriptional regulator with XRE-family HTH domain
MDTFGKKLKDCREAKEFSQAKLAKEVGLHHSIIGRYEREEAKPTIDVVKRLANVLDTTVGYLLGESEDRDLLKDPAMLKRLNEIEKMDGEDKIHILHVLDGFIKSVKLKNIAAL